MRIHNLTKAQDPGQLCTIYPLNHIHHLLANRVCQGRVVHLDWSQARAVQLRTLFVSSEIYLNNRVVVCR